MKHILKPALSLFIIAAVVTALLGIVHTLTLDPIDKKNKAAQEKAQKEVLPQAGDFRKIIPGEGAPSGASSGASRGTGNIVSIFEGLSEGVTVGYVIELDPAGYSGKIRMMVGISKTDNKITGMRILRHTETPGLGARAVHEKFYRQYDGKQLVPLKIVKASPGNAGADEIEVITGSTITTRAITNAVNEAIQWYNGVNAE
jgi:electron transport complex protein RnfG